MTSRRLAAIVSLLRQGFAVEREFGTRSLEAMVEVADTVETSVYRDGSLCLTPNGLGFVLDNPPLRMGAFARVTLRVDGTSLPPESVRLRPGEGSAWRTAATVRRDTPLFWPPGQPMEFDLTLEVPARRGEAGVRLELESVAIPPRVWLEFRDRVSARRDE